MDAMSYRLPIEQKGARFSFATELEAVAFTIEFRWNDRDSGWYMQIGDSDGTPLISGIKVVTGILLLGRATSKLLPKGDFMAIDTAGTMTDPAFEDLGRRVQVVYITSAELLAA